MAWAGGGVAGMIDAAGEVVTSVGNVRLRLSEAKDYPFRDQIHITVKPERALAFPLKLRVPGWALGARVSVNGQSVSNSAKDGFIVIDRTWHSGDRVDLAVGVETRTEPGFNQSVSVQHGALLFSLPIREKWEKLRDQGLTADWEVYPTSAWNYGIEEGARFQRIEQPVTSIPFSSQNPPVIVTTKLRPVPEWTTDTDYASPPPVSPVAVADGAPEVVTLI